MLDTEQLRPPLRKGGLGIQCLTTRDGIVCKAGFLAAASLTQRALTKGAHSFQPFQSECGKDLEQVWQEVRAACTCKGACTCEHLEPQSLSEALSEGSLQGLQHVMSQTLADSCHEQLLDKYRNMLRGAETKAAAQQHLSRLLSVQHNVATAWLNIVPTKDAWEIDDDTVKTALRFMLGVSLGPPP